MTHELTPEVLITGVQPTYAHPGDAGADLRAATAHVLAPGERVLVPTGTFLALPHGFVAYVMPRSGLALRHGIGLVNSPGVIDAGYRGEISVVMINHDRQESFSIEPGDRIAQLVVSPVARAVFQPVTALPGSVRDTGGFGSTGIQGGSA
jgi:dUTP pyrophosphatase